jgi:hypothetical protein
MKVLTQEEIDAHQHAALIGGMKGAAFGTSIGLPLAFYLYKKWPYYRTLPPALKAFGVIIFTVPACIIKAERDGNEFERTRWTGVGKAAMDDAAHEQQVHWESLDNKGKMLDWAARKRYTIVGGAWAASMVGSFGIIMRNRYLTFPQKLVQARMWAQGLTVAVLVASAGLSQVRPATHKAPVDHTWRDFIGEKDLKTA